MAGYTRFDITDQIANGNTVDAVPLDGEFNAIQGAFASTGGHKHDGSVGEGAPITTIGPAQDVVASSNSLTPKTDNTVDLGTSSLEFKDLWIDGVANIDSLVADTADINAGTIDNTVIGGNSPAAVTATTFAATSATVGGVAVTTNTATQTLTNKTLNLANNTLVATSAQMAAAVTDETGSGALVFAASPALSGVPTAPTAAADTNTTQIATTAHVFAERSNAATLTNKNISGGTITGITDLAVADGGTGVSSITGIIRGNGTSPFSAAVAGTDFLSPAAIGTTVQAYDADLQTIAGLTKPSGNYIGSDGASWVSKTPAQVRSDLSINGIGSETAPTITNLNTLTVAGEYFAASGATGSPNAEPITVKMYAADATTRAAQEAIGLTSGRKWRRVEAAGAWGAWTEFQNALGFTPVEQGGGAGMLANKVRIGWTGSKVRVNVDGTDIGNLLTSSAASVAGDNALQTAGAIGTYGLFLGPTLNPGDTVAGSLLSWASASGAGGAVATGTWRCMGRTTGAGGAGNTTLFLRIS